MTKNFQDETGNNRLETQMTTQKVTNRDINYKFNTKTQEVTNKAF